MDTKKKQTPVVPQSNEKVVPYPDRVPEEPSLSGRQTGDDTLAHIKTEFELNRIQGILQQSQSIAHVGSWEYNLQTKEMVWSDEVYRLYGYEPGSVQPSMAIFRTHTLPEDQHLLTAISEGGIPVGEVLTFFRRIQDTAGRLRYLQTTAHSKPTPIGGPAIIIGAVQDITTLKQTEKELQEKEHFLNQVADATSDLIYVYDLELNRSIYLNKQIMATLGYSLAQIKELGENFKSRLLHPADTEKLEAHFEHILNNSNDEVIQIEFRIKDAGGNYRWLRARNKIFKRNTAGIPIQIIGVSKDITNRKAAAEELKIKNNIITGIIHNLPIIISTVQPDGTIHTITGSGLSSINQRATDLAGTNIAKLFPEAAGNLANVNTETVLAFETAIPTGKKIKIFQSYFFNDSETGTSIGFSIDITAQKEMEKQARTEKEFSESLLNNSVDGIMAFDKTFRITSWNKVLERNSRLRKEEVLGRRVLEMFPGFRGSDIEKGLQKVLKGKRVALLNQTFGLRFSEFEVFLNPLFNDRQQVTGGLAIIHDVTIRNRLEAARSTEKLEQEKEMLNVVLQTQEAERRRIAEILHNSLGQLLYGVKLNFEQVKALNKELPDELNKTTANISGLLDEAIRQVRTISFELMPTILEDFGLAVGIIELCKKLSTQNLHFNCFHQGFERRLSKSVEIILYRIVQELINNVIRHAGASEAIIHLIRTKKSVLISIEDNGIGLDQEKLLHYHGGIGLKSIRSQLKLINAHMTIDSRPGNGTLITIKMAL